MPDNTSKVVTLENLSTFKAKMDEDVEEKIAESAGASLSYATDEDIEALFAAETSSGTD